MHVRPERDQELQAHLKALAHLVQMLPRAVELSIPLHGGPQYHARIVLPHPNRRGGEVTAMATGETKLEAMEAARLAVVPVLKEIFLHAAPASTPDTSRALRDAGAGALDPAEEPEVPKRWRPPSGPTQATLFG